MKANDMTLYSRNGGDWRARGNKLSALDKLNPPRFKYFERFLPRWTGLRVLDIGCGAGFTAEFLARRGASVTGIDPAEPALQTAEAHAYKEQLTINYAAGTAEDVPFPDNVFDVVICVDVLEHVANLEKSLREAHRVLKPGGYLLFDTINKTFVSRVVMIWLLECVLRVIPRGAHDWHMFIPPQHLQKSLQEVQFKNIRLSGFPFRLIMYIGIAQKAF